MRLGPGRRESAPMPEQVFFDEAGVLVTTTRVVIAGQTFALANVTSVRVTPDMSHAANVAGVVMGAGAILGAATAYLTSALPGVMVFCILAGSAGLVGRLFAKRMVTIASAGSEFKALSSSDGPFIDRVARAISDAIVARG